MPTLEDTAIDFPVTTLNDLLEAEAKAGVAAGADEEKYRKWAFISTGAAGLLAIILAVVLVTGGSDSGGASDKASVKADAFKDLQRRPLKVAGIGTDIALEAGVDVYKGSTLIVSDAKVTKIEDVKVGVDTLEVAVTPEQFGKLAEAFPGSEKATVVKHVPGTETTTATSAPTTTAPAPTPETAPAATTPPATG
jgi:hypothetical protein